MMGWGKYFWNRGNSLVQGHPSHGFHLPRHTAPVNPVPAIGWLEKAVIMILYLDQALAEQRPASATGVLRAVNDDALPLLRPKLMTVQDAGRFSN